MKFIRDNLKKDEGVDLNAEFEASGEGLAEFLWRVIEREAKADGYRTDMAGARCITFSKSEEEEFGEYAKKFLGKEYRPDEFLETLLKGIKYAAHKHFEVTYEHVDYGNNDPVLLVVRF